MPETLVGQYLRAYLRRETVERQRLKEALDRTGWVDAQFVIEAAFATAVRRRFGGRRARNIPRLLDRLQRGAGAEVPREDTEALVRNALEPTAAAAGVDPETALISKLLVLLMLYEGAGLMRGPWLAALLRRAEERALRDGHHPTPA